MGFTGEEVAGGARPVRLAIDYSERKTQAKERPTAYSKSKAADDGNSCRADRFFLRKLSR